MTFKESVRADNKRVLVNLKELAELVNVRYSGTDYRDVPAVMMPAKDQKIRSDVTIGNRGVPRANHTQGIFLGVWIMYYDINDMDGVRPAYGKRIYISTAEDGDFYEEWYIASSSCDMGLVKLTLEKLDE